MTPDPNLINRYLHERMGKNNWELPDDLRGLDLWALHNLADAWERFNWGEVSCDLDRYIDCWNRG